MPEDDDRPEEVDSGPVHFPQTNQLARISMVIGIGTMIGSVFLFFTARHDGLTILFLFSLLLTSVFGAFCGHSACRQIRVRHPKQTGEAMARKGIAGSYVCIVVVILFFVVFMQGTV